MVGDFDAVEVCCETVVACVEPEVCDCVVSGFVFVILLTDIPSQDMKLEHNIPSAVCVLPPEDERVMLETCTGPYS
jgi:hypothetical protein